RSRWVGTVATKILPDIVGICWITTKTACEVMSHNLCGRHCLAPLVVGIPHLPGHRASSAARLLFRAFPAHPWKVISIQYRIFDQTKRNDYLVLNFEKAWEATTRSTYSADTTIVHRRVIPSRKFNTWTSRPI